MPMPEKLLRRHFFGKLLRKLSSRKSFSRRVGCEPPTAGRCTGGGALATARSLGVWEDGGLWPTVASLAPLLPSDEY